MNMIRPSDFSISSLVLGPGFADVVAAEIRAADLADLRMPHDAHARVDLAQRLGGGRPAGRP